MSTSPGLPESGAEWQVVGLGSYLNSDDQIGLVLVEALSREARWDKRCVLWEGADAAAITSSLMERHRPAVLVDAADMNLAPGDYRFFAENEASVILKSSLVSTHGLGLAEGLELARTLGFDQRIYIFGVQPYDLSPGQGLTPEMTARFPLLLEALIAACSRLS